jgi:hypothetical protein
VVDSNKLFACVNAGSPACVYIGDAGLYQRTQLKRSIDTGILNQLDIPLRIVDQVQHIKPFLGGDAAFALGTHMLKNFTPPPPAGSARSTFNIRLTICRRRVEVAIGELWGRWAVCKRIVCWNDMNFLREVTGVCCALHNSMPVRGVAYDERWATDGDNAVQAMQMLAHVGGNAHQGVAVRDILAAHLATE